MPLKLNSAAGGSITLDVPSNLTTANTLTLPSIVGNSAYALTNSPTFTGNVAFTGNVSVNTGTVNAASFTVGTALTANSSGITTTGTVADGTATLRPIVPMSSVTLTTQSTVDFTNIPSWVQKITVIFYGVSLTGGDKPLIQLGTSGGIVSSGYQSWESSGGTSTSGILYPGTTSTDTRYGLTQFALLDGVGAWVCTGLCNNNGGNIGSDQRILAIVNLGAQLTQLRLTRTGTNTFDAGSINVIYE